MKEIALTGKYGLGKYTKVDDDIYEVWGGKRWWYHKGKYAVTKLRNKHVYLHHIVCPPPKGYFIDHANRDRLDNRRENLRVANRSQNGINRTKQPNNTTGYKGVTIDKRLPIKKYYAALQYRKDGKKHCYSLGNYATAEEAAKAYDAKVLELYGEFACTNFSYSSIPKNLDKQVQHQ